MEFKF